MNLNNAQKKMLEFMKAAKQECPLIPVMPYKAVRKLRVNLCLEELQEMAFAMGFLLVFNPKTHAIEFESVAKDLDLIAAYDGMIDLLYVTLGTFVACGLNAQEGFDEVHRSNMTKFIDGTFREDGKYIKGPSYSKPNLEQIIEQAQEIWPKDDLQGASNQGEPDNEKQKQERE